MKNKKFFEIRVRIQKFKCSKINNLNVAGHRLTLGYFYKGGNELGNLVENYFIE